MGSLTHIESVATGSSACYGLGGEPMSAVLGRLRRPVDRASSLVSTGRTFRIHCTLGGLQISPGPPHHRVMPWPNLTSLNLPQIAL